MSRKTTNTIVFLLFFLFFILFPDYLIWESNIAGTDRWWVDVLWSLPTVLILVAFVCTSNNFYHNTFFRLIFALLLCVVLPKLLFLLLQYIVGWQIAVVAAVALIGVFIYGFFFGWRRIVVRTADCTSKLLPECFDGYRILQLSDIHIGTFRADKGFISKLVKMVNDQHPDLIVFTGDLVNVNASELLPFQTTLSQLHAPDGVYSVMGNHDYCEYGQDHSVESHKRKQHILEYLEEKMGWYLLKNQHVAISRMEKKNDEQLLQTIYLIGVENISKPPFHSFGDLPKAMEGLIPGTFKILLSHDPTHWRRGVLHRTDIALTLSGHTHAGQLKIGSFSPVKWAYNEWGGKYTEGDAMLYVSLGIGGTVPFRFGAWPEINVITLRKA